MVTFHRLDAGTTRVTTQMEFDPAGFAEHVADKAGLLKRRTKDDLVRFKAFIKRR